MPTIDLNRAASNSYTNSYQNPVSTVFDLYFGDQYGAAFPTYIEQTILEFDVDPSTIDTSSAVTLEFEVLSTHNTASTHYINRWVDPWPSNSTEMQDETSFTTTNQVSFSSSTGTKSLDIRNIVADAATAGQTKLIIGIPEADASRGGEIDHVPAPTLTYNVSSGSSSTAASVALTAPSPSFSATGLTLATPLTLTVALSPDAVQNGSTSTATVTRSGGDTASDLTISLQSSDPSVAIVQSTATFPAGVTSIDVPVSSVKVGTTDISALRAGATTGSDTLTVKESVSLSLASSTIYGTNTTTVTVTRTGNTTNAAVLDLSSDATGVATVPATVTIPSGQASATATVTGVDVGTANINASNSLYTSTGAIAVTVEEAITLAIAVSPDSINADQTTTATITRTTSDNSSPLVVNLSSDNNSVATIPATVTIAASQNSNTVTVTGVGAGTANLSASHVSSSNTPSDALTVSDPLVLSVSIDPNPFNSDQTSTVTVTRSGGDQTNPLTVDLTSSATGVATIPASVTILANENSGSVTLTGVATGTTTITASHADAALDATAVASVNGALGLNISVSPNPVNAGQTSTATITRAGGDQTISLTVSLTSSTTSVATIPATVTIPANQVSATVSVSAVAAGSATLTVSHPDADTDGTASLTVNNPLVLAASISPDPINVGQTSTLTVTRTGGDQTAPLVVVLSSSVSTVATIPPSLTIAANETTGTATITGVGTGVTVISVTHSTAQTATDTITVNSPLVLGLSLARSTANAGQLTTATVTRTGGNINSSLTVTLSSSNDSYATVPSSVSIPAGSISAQFSVTGVSAGTATITASHTDATSNGTADIQVFAAPTLAVVVSPDPTFVGTATVVTVTRSGGDTSQTMTVTLASSDTTRATVPSSVIIQANKTSATAALTALLDGTLTITASNQYVDVDATDGITIYPKLVLGVTVSPDTFDDASTATATVTRTGGNTTSQLIVTLASTDVGVATVPASVTIPANQLTATATVTAVGAGTASIRASHANAPDVAQDSIEVTEALVLAASLNPDTIAEGGTTKLTVARSGGDLTDPLTVQLSSSDIIVASVQATVTFAVGETSTSVDVTGIDNGTSTISVSHADAALDATDVLTVTPAVVRRAGAPIIDDENHFVISQRDDYEDDGEIGAIGPIRIETDLDITAVANRLRFGATRLRGGSASSDHMIGTAYAEAVAGTSNQYDLYIEITRTETDKQVGEYGWDIECVFSDADIRTLVSGEFTLQQSFGDNETRDPLNP